MNNDAYKLKYLKYKAKYMELKDKNGGMLALQSRQMVQEREIKPILERRAILEEQKLYQLNEREQKIREKIENLPIELKELIITNGITNCKELLNARKISKSMRNTIDYNIDKIYNYIYNYLRDDKPELSREQIGRLNRMGIEIPEAKLHDLREEFKQINLQDISMEEKMKEKRQLIINQCYRQKFLNNLKVVVKGDLRKLNRIDFNKYMILSKHMLPNDPSRYSTRIATQHNDKFDEIISLLKKGIYYNYVIDIIEYNWTIEKINNFVKLLDGGFRNNDDLHMFAEIMVNSENITNEQSDKMIKLLNNGFNYYQIYIAGMFFSNEKINELIKLINDGITQPIEELEIYDSIFIYNKIYDSSFSKSEQNDHFERWSQVAQYMNFY